MKEMKLDRHEFNLLVNDILLDVKPVKLRITIANRLIEFFDKKQERIAELEQENESYQKLINDICNKHRVGSLKDLDEIYQATTESLYASREYLEELKSAKWELEEQLKNARKETAKKVIDRVEELSVFDFKAYEEHDLRKYTITELALDVILREYGETNG